MSSPAISLDRIRLSFKGDFLFRDFSLEIPGGQTTCLLGPSGVGKSSLLRLIAGLEARDSGTVTCEGELPLQGNFSYMAQQDLLLPWLTLRENVSLSDRLQGHAPDPGRAEELIRRVGLAGHEDKRPAALSGGMRQRAALARTLYQERDIILMDEPFSAVDSITRLELQDLAAEVFHSRTVLLVTHDPLEALRLGHQLLVLADQPVEVTQRITPPGNPPRETGAAEMPELHKLLIDSLRKAHNQAVEKQREIQSAE